MAMHIVQSVDLVCTVKIKKKKIVEMMLGWRGPGESAKKFYLCPRPRLGRTAIATTYTLLH